MCRGFLGIFCRAILLAPTGGWDPLPLALSGQDRIPSTNKKPPPERGWWWGEPGGTSEGTPVVLVSSPSSGSEGVRIRPRVVLAVEVGIVPQVRFNEEVVRVDVVHEFRVVGVVFHVRSIAHPHRMSSPTHKKKLSTIYPPGGVWGLRVLSSLL